MIIVFEEKSKRAWEIHATCPIKGQKQFLSNSLWEGDQARAKKQLQENKTNKTKVKGRDKATLLSCLQAALSGLAQQSGAKQMDGNTNRQAATPGSSLGKIYSFCHWANRSSILSLENFFGHSNSRDMLLLSTPRAERRLLFSWVRDHGDTISPPEDG